MTDKLESPALAVVVLAAGQGTRMGTGRTKVMQPVAGRAMVLYVLETAAALARFDDQGGMFISVLTDPTTGGVTASFAMLGDVILAEPKALIGFAGPRVIEQTIRQQLPEGFQRAEFVLECGFVDRVVPRSELRSEISRIIDYAGK